MLRFVVLAIVLVSFANANDDFQHVVEEDSAIVFAKTGHYAITSAQLNGINWASVSVNGNRATIVTPECKTFDKMLSDLSETEASSVAAVRQSLKNLDSRDRLVYNGNQYLIEKKRYATLTGWLLSFYSEDGLTVQKLGDKHYFVKKNNLPNHIKSVVFDEDKVTFVYSDGHILMRPSSCLDGSEKQLFEELQADVARTSPKQ